VAAETAHLRAAEQLFPSAFKDSDFAHLLATAATTRYRSGDLRAAHAESADANEYSAGQCDQRSERSDRTVDCAGHRCRERDPWKLAELSHPRIQSSRADTAKSLEGTWRQELIFVLQQELEMYDTYQRRVAECDEQLKKHLASFVDATTPQAKEDLPPKKKKKQNKNNPPLQSCG